MAKDQLEALVAEHRKFRKIMEDARAEMDALEEQMRPLQARAGALAKLQAAGLSEAEIASLTGGD